MMWLSCQLLRRKLLQQTTCCHKPIKPFTSFPSPTNPVQVLVSLSPCPFENLAFEEYIYDNISFGSDQRLLFLWRNAPSVVIGRHQNPWLELNLDLARRECINICRRQSGGGTVYHDLGNMNLTFFTDRKTYDRKENLDFIIRTLSGNYGLDLTRNSKDDILYNGVYKVSGTAAKLGTKTAYHHCTLLCDTNLNNIQDVLTRTFGELDTNATKSCPSPTANLFENTFDFGRLCKVFHRSYNETYTQQQHNSLSDIMTIYPSQIEGIAEKVDKLKAWEWIYEKTPAFTTSNKLVLADGHSCDIQLRIRKGVVVDVEVVGELPKDGAEVVQFLLSKLVNQRFCYDHFVSTMLSENEERGYRVAQIK